MIDNHPRNVYDNMNVFDIELMNANSESEKLESRIMTIEAATMNKIQNIRREYKRKPTQTSELKIVGDIYNSLRESHRNILKTERMFTMLKSHIRASPLRQKATVLVQNLKSERIMINPTQIANSINMSCRLVMIYVHRNAGISFMKNVNNLSISLPINYRFFHIYK